MPQHTNFVFWNLNELSEFLCQFKQLSKNLHDINLSVYHHPYIYPTWVQVFQDFDLPFEKTGVWPVSCSSTLAARVNLSPDSPTQILRHSFIIRRSLIVLFFFSFGASFLGWKVKWQGLGTIKVTNRVVFILHISHTHDLICHMLTVDTWKSQVVYIIIYAWLSLRGYRYQILRLQ